MKEEVYWTLDGSPTVQQDKEKMHHSGGAFSETQLVYGDAIRWILSKPLPNYRFFSMGLGLGYVEFLIAEECLNSQKEDSEIYLESWESNSQLIDQLLEFINPDKGHISSPEKEPISPLHKERLSPPTEEQLSLPQNINPFGGEENDSLYDKILSFYKQGERIKRWLWSQYKNHRWIIHTTLREDLRNLNPHLPFHCICYDAFSSKMTPELWSDSFLSSFLQKLTSSAPCIFVSYACTGRLKRALKKHHFEVTQRPGFLGKRNSTWAIKEKPLNSLPYRRISEFYHSYFGGKVFKIPLSLSEDCPNRRGIKGMTTCVFCDEWGSAAHKESFKMDLQLQINTYKKSIAERYHAEMFLAYFQSYTTLFSKLSTIKEAFNIALSHPFIKGLVIGTRPDTYSQAILNLWNELKQRTFITTELGVQSFYDHHLNFLRRGHNSIQSYKAIETIHKQTGIPIGIHLIFGLPGESLEEVMKTAKICNELPIQNVKLHHLHVLKNTPLHELYSQGRFSPISFEKYAETIQVFLEYLSPHIYVHRLSGFSARWDELVAPQWTNDKMKTFQGLIDHLQQKNTYQGRYFTR